MDQTLHTAINWLDREDIVAILEDHGFACYDNEATQELREALREGVEDGTIDVSAIHESGI